jgi:hypothetical protein
VKVSVLQQTLVSEVSTSCRSIGHGYTWDVVEESMDIHGL